LTEQDIGEKIEILVNGLQEQVSADTTVAVLVSSHGEEGGDLIVERNHRFVFPQEYETTFFEAGDQIELIHADFGG
jgi:thiamine biosynthesis protein ThiS